MSEVILTAEFGGLMSAMKSNAAVEGDTSGAFGAIMSSMMGCGNADAEVMSETMVSSEALTMDAADDVPVGLSELLALLKGTMTDGEMALENDIILPEEFSEEGCIAFLKTLDAFLDGEISPADIKKLWENVSDEEKTAFVGLMQEIFSDNDNKIVLSAENDHDISIDSEDVNVNDIIAALVALTGKTAMKHDDEETENENAAYQAAEGMIISQMTNDVQIVETENVIQNVISVELTENQPKSNAVIQNVDGDDIIQNVNVVSPDVPEQANAESNVQDVEFDEFIQNVYSKTAEAEPEKLREFVQTLSDELKAEVTKPDNGIDTEQLFSGRQAFMSRVKNPYEVRTDMAPVSMPVQSNEIETVTVEASDMTAQMAERISMYEDVIGGSDKELTMRLTPDELGEIQVKIIKSDDGITVAFAAEKSEAAELIGNRAAALAEALAAKGIALKEMSVTEQIVTHESSNNAMEYSGGNNPFGNSQAGGEFSGHSRRFSFVQEGLSADSSDAAADDGISEIYYNREARLWVSA